MFQHDHQLRSLGLQTADADLRRGAFYVVGAAAAGDPRFDQRQFHVQPLQEPRPGLRFLVLLVQRRAGIEEQAAYARRDGLVGQQANLFGFDAQRRRRAEPQRRPLIDQFQRRLRLDRGPERSPGPRHGRPGLQPLTVVGHREGRAQRPAPQQENVQLPAVAPQPFRRLADQRPIRPQISPPQLSRPLTGQFQTLAVQPAPQVPGQDAVVFGGNETVVGRRGDQPQADPLGLAELDGGWRRGQADGVKAQRLEPLERLAVVLDRSWKEGAAADQQHRAVQLGGAAATGSPRPSAGGARRLAARRRRIAIGGGETGRGYLP